jgi:glutamate transport system substrate-binding protein
MAAWRQQSATQCRVRQRLGPRPTLFTAEELPMSEAGHVPTTPVARSAKGGRWRRGATMLSIIAMVLLAGAAKCAEDTLPTETVESLRAKSPTLQNRERLRIGVRETIPLLSYIEPKTGARTGFEIQIARELARELGYSDQTIDWVPVSTVPSRLAALQNDQVDIVVASLSITADRELLVDFAGPYLLVPQALLVDKKRTKRLETIADLRAPGVRVCTGTGSTSERALVAKGITPEPVDNDTQCKQGMDDGTYDAYSTDLPILASFVQSNPDRYEVLDLEIADFSERIGVAVPEGDTALGGLIAYFLDRWRSAPDNPWLAAYDQTIGPGLGPRYRSQPLVANVPQLADFDSKTAGR